jgi:hypothetical protein
MRFPLNPQRFTINHLPPAEDMRTMQKTATIDVAFVPEPFEVETQEGVLYIHPENVEDWDDGYYVAYPSDGSKPYAISPSFIRENYEEI